MELHHLRYFVAVADHLSFSGAARSLHMATSPLSQRVRDLERELGTTLFERDSHHVGLTEAGVSLLPIARDVLGRVDDIPWRLRQATSRGRREAYLGIPPGLHTHLRDRLAGFTQICAPQLDLKRWPGGSRELLSGVQRGELAMAMVHLPVHAEGIDVVELLREPLGAVLPAADFADRASVSLHELTRFTYARPPAHMLPDYWDEVDARLTAAGIHRRVRLASGDYAGAADVVANGDTFAVSMLDPDSGIHTRRSDHVVVLPFDDFPATLRTGLIWRSDRIDEQPGLRDLVDATRQALSDAAR